MMPRPPMEWNDAMVSVNGMMPWSHGMEQCHGHMEWNDAMTIWNEMMPWPPMATLHVWNAHLWYVKECPDHPATHPGSYGHP